MKRSKNPRWRSKQRRMMLESLESRQLLAVDTIHIDLGGADGADLLGPGGGGSIHDGYAKGTVGISFQTSNVPGQNNELPVAGADGRAMGQDDPAIELLTSDLLANDFDPDSADPPTFVGIQTDGTRGSVAYDDVAGKVLYDPNGEMDFVPGGETGTDSFTYTIADAKGGIGTGTVSITINGVNDAPSFTPGADVAVDEDAGPQTINGWATDVTDGDRETDGLAFEITGNTNSALFSAGPTVDADGNLTFTPADDAFGAADITLRINDQHASDNLSASETFTITVNAVNDAPGVPAKTFAATGNVPMTVPNDATALFAGVTDVDGGGAPELVSVDATTTGGGSITGVNLTTGEFSYQSAPGFTGTDTFDFMLTDGTTARTQTATITVANTIWFVDSAAAPGGDGTLGSPFDSFTPLNNDGNDIDDPGDVIFVAEGTGPYDLTDGDPAHDAGLVLEANQILVGEGADDSVTVTLEAWLAANASINVAANSAALPAIGGNLPELTNTTGDVVTVSTDNTITGVTLNPVASAGIAGDGVSGLVVEFVIIITSGGSGDNEGIRLQTVSGTLTFENLDIESAVGETNTGTAIQIDGGTASLQFNDVDIDQDGGSLLSIVNTFASSLMFDEDSELTLQGSDEVAVVIADNDSGTVILNNDDIDVTTTATIAYSITGNTDLAASTPINDAPVFNVPSESTVLEDAGTVTIPGFATDISPGLDPSESDQVLTFEILSNSGEDLFDVLPAVATDGTLTYTLKPDTVGSAEIAVRLKDDGGTDDGGSDTSTPKTFTISATPVNDQPSFVIDGDPAAVPEDAGAQSISGFAHTISTGPEHESDQMVTFVVTDNTNPDWFAVAPAISPSGELTYMPADDAEGTATITVVLQDDGGIDDGGVDMSAAETFEITISPAINDPPTFDLVASIEADVHDGEHTETDAVTNVSVGPDNESDQTVTMSVTVDTNASMFAAAPTLDASGNLMFTPEATGIATLTIIATDDGGTEHGGVDTTSKQVTITIVEANRAPVLDSVGNHTVDEGTELTFAVTADDINGDDLTFSLDGAPSGAIITESGLFTWTPDENQGPQSHTFDVRVTDGEFTAAETIAITVNEVNVAPVLDPIIDRAVDEGSELRFIATATDSDEPGNTLTFSVLGVNHIAVAEITDDGEFTWTPDEAYGPGEYLFSVNVSDGRDLDIETFTVTVNEANAIPVLDPIGDQTVDEGTELTFITTGSDTDEPEQDLIFSLDSNAPATAQITPDGEFSWTPDEADGPGDHTFGVIISDGIDSSMETITVSVGEVNTVPQIDAIADVTIDEGQLLTFTATADDTDQPLQALTYSLDPSVELDQPAGAEISEQGVFSWTPSEDQGEGTYTIGLIVSDGTLTDATTFTVTVDEVNTAPELDAIGDQTASEGSELSFTATAIDNDRPDNQLTFSLTGDDLTNASISPAGDFSFTPNESQGPGTFIYTIEVTDGELVDSETFSVSVGEVNEAPALTPIGNRSVNEKQTLSFTADTSDADLPSNDLTFSLTGSVPAGAEITQQGEFSWTPNETEGPGSFTFNVVVNDGTTEVSESITVEVYEVNDAPTFEILQSDVAADVNDGARTIAGFVHSVASGPAGEPTQNVLVEISAVSDLSIFTNAPTLDANGQLSFTPSNVGTATITVSATDDGGTAAGGINQSQSQFTITISEQNLAPELDFVSDQETSDGAQLIFSATASDPNGDNLVFSLSNAPAGANITDGGEFSWTPTVAQIGQHTFDVVVTDDGEGSLADSQTITIIVNAVDPFATVEIYLDQINEPGESVWYAFAIDMEVDHDDTNPATKLLFAAPDDPGDFQQLMGGPISGYADVEQEDDETASEFLQTFSGDWAFRIDFDGNGFSVAEGDEEITIAIDVEDALGDFPVTPTITSPTNDGDVSLADGTPSVTWTGINQSQTDLIYVRVVETDGDELVDADLSVSDTSVELVGAEAGTTLEGEVGAILKDDDGQWASRTSGAAALQFSLGSFASFEADVVDGVGGGFEDYEVGFGFLQASYNGQDLLLAELDVVIDHDAVIEQTSIQVKSPRSASFVDLMGGFGNGYFDILADAGESVDQFVSSLDGLFDVRVDLNGDGQFDELQFDFTIDVSGITGASFPDAPTLSAPTVNHGQRSVTLDWLTVNDGDSLVAGVHLNENNDLLDTIALVDLDLDVNQTSFTADLLPTDVPLTAVLGTFDELPSIATGDGEFEVFLATIATADLTIIGQPVSVAAGDSVGIFAGGSSTVGGLDFDFAGVEQSAQFSGPYFAPSDYDAWAYFLGGGDRLQQAWQDFGITNEDNFQLWHLDLTSNGQDVTFDDVELTFKYNETLLGTEWQSAAEMEPLLAIFHFDQSSGEWVAAPVVQRSLGDDTITIIADDFSPFVLGVSFDDPPQADYDAELVVGIAESNQAGEVPSLFGFIELGFEGANVPLSANSAVFVQQPGDSEYLLLDGHYFENDHDANPSTPPIKYLDFDRDFEQGALTSAEFQSSLQGTWTVLVDTDGDFDPQNPNEETDQDAKFTFDVTGIDLASIPPAPTITDPIHDSIIDGEGVALAWNVESGSMAGVDVDVQVFSDDANIHHNQLTPVGQTANVPELPGGTDFQAEVIHVNENGGYVGNLAVAPGFGSFPIDETIGLYGAFHSIDFTTSEESIAEADFSIVQATFNGADLKFLNIELDTEDPRVTSASKVIVTTPLQSGITFDWVDPWIDVKESENETVADFISDLSGDYVFEYDFDGDTTIDDFFTINLDLSSITAGMFPTETVVTSPIANSVLPVTDRELTITWNENITAEEMFVEVGSNDFDAYFFEAEPDTSVTSVTTGGLPSGIQLGANVVAGIKADSAIAQTSGTAAADISFALATLTPIDFEITPHVKTISPTDRSGFYAGGSDVAGGATYDFDGLAGLANLSIEYLTADNYDSQVYAAGQDPEGVNGQFHQIGPVSWDHLQTWQLSVTDGSGNDVGFTHVDLELGYDDSLFDNQAHTASFMKDHLVAYQWDGSQWQALETLSASPWDNRLQVRATHTAAPIVLGYDPSAAMAPWQPAGQIGIAEMEVLRVENVFATTKFIANVEFLATHPDAWQGTEMEIKLPGETEFQSYDLDDGGVFIEADFNSLADLIAARDGTYEVRTHHDTDGQFDAEFSATFDLSGLTESDLPDAPTINSPTTSTIVVDDQPTIVAWEPQTDTDGTFVVVFEGSEPAEDNDLRDFDLSELQSSLAIDDLPLSQTLLLGVGINETHHDRASSSSSDGGVDVELELTSLVGIVFGGAALHVVGGENVCHAEDSVSESQLAPIITAAIERLSATGLTESQIEQLESTNFEIANLRGGLIGLTQADTITIDINAAGHGWFIDPTPLDDDEFEADEMPGQIIAGSGPAATRIDLLTAVMHEFGHVLGLDDHDDEEHHWMYENLKSGVRKDGDWDAAILGWVNGSEHSR